MLHCCCGPCSTASVLRLLDENWQPVLYFGNSNIYPEEENKKRLNELKKVAEFHNLEVITSPYNHEEWLAFIKGLEAEKEHGARCVKCFEFNLREAESVAEKLGIRHFTTSLTVSRFKNSAVIFKVGRVFEGFEEIDFKKKDGFAKSVRLSVEMGLYRQNYCGCEFSLADSAKNKQAGQPQ